jgi:streptogramin lyase
MTVGPDGNLWFTESGASKIAEINPTTHAVSEFPTPTNSSLGPIVAGPDGNLWFVETGASQIGMIDPTTHAIAEFPTPTPNSLPEGIAADPYGNLWFTEHNSSNIAEINPTTHAISEFPTPTANSGPEGITAGPDGNLWFTETTTGPGGNSGQIGEINPTTHAFTETPAPAGSLLFSITTGPDGNLWFADGNPSGGSIGEINPSTHAVSEFAVPTPHSLPQGITAGPDGNLWFTEAWANKVGEINPSTHAVSEFAVPTPLPSPPPFPPPAGPWDITAGPDGNLWFTENAQGQIGEVVLRQTPAVTWSSPADIPYGTALGTAAQLDATASVPGTFAYNPAAGTVLGAGANQPLSVTFTPADAVHYKTVTAGTTINVLQATPAFSNLTSDPVTAGAASATVSGTLSAPTAIPAGDTVTVTVGGASATATVQADGSFTATLPSAGLAVGSYTIGYRYAGGANFNAASGSGTLLVTNGVAVLSSNSQPVPGGSTLPVEVGLTDAAGANTSSAAVAVHADYLVAAADPGQAHLPVQAPGNSQPGNFFKFRGGRYHFDLKTAGLAPGTYELFFSAAGDPVEHSLSFTVK